MSVAVNVGGARTVLNGYPSKVALSNTGKSFEITYWYGGEVSGHLFVGSAEAPKLLFQLQRAIDRNFTVEGELTSNPEAAPVHIQPKTETLEDLAEAVHNAIKRFDDAAAAEFPDWTSDTEQA